MGGGGKSRKLQIWKEQAFEHSARAFAVGLRVSGSENHVDAFGSGFTQGSNLDTT